MANKSVNSSIPALANLLGLYHVGPGVDEANPSTRGAWDAKNSVFWPVVGSGTWNDVALGSSGYTGLAAPEDAASSIYTAASDYSTNTPMDLRGTAWTMLYQVKWTNSGGRMIVATNRDSFGTNLGGWLVRINSGGSLEFSAAVPSVTLFSSANLTLNQVHTIAFTLSGGTLTCYIDGTARGSASVSGGVLNYPDSNAGGATRRAALVGQLLSSGTVPGPGTLFLAGFWDVALSAGQIQSFATNSTQNLAGQPQSVAFAGAAVAPAITTQPSAQTVTAGSTATFTAAASGSPAPTWQWQRSTDSGSTWANISGATAASYTTPATTVSGGSANNGDRYRAVATNSAGAATTSAVALTVNAASTAPSITTQPSAQSVVAGSTATFTAAASGTPAPTWQWQRSTNGGSTWTDISGATAASYTTPATTVTGGSANSGDQYRAVATNSAGAATTSAVALTVSAAAVAPSITTQPSAQTVTAGSTATFTAAASGSPAPTWQWQRSTDSGSTWANISGATAASYTTPATTVSGGSANNGDRYRAVATNSAGAATTSAVALTVNASGSGTITVPGVKNGSGTLLASATFPNVVVLQRSDRARLLALTNQTTNSGGDLVVTNAALTPGVACQVVAFSADGLQAGCWPATVA